MFYFGQPRLEWFNAQTLRCPQGGALDQITMNICRQAHIVVVEDGTGARYGLGVIVPAMLVGLFFLLVWPAADGRMPFAMAALAFAATAVALALLMAPRQADFDLERRAVRLSVGWPLLLGRRATIPFSAIREAKVSQHLQWNDGEFGAARPVLVLYSGQTILLSAYKRSPERCREIVEQIRPLLRGDSTYASG